MPTGRYEKLQAGDVVGGIEVLGKSHTDSGGNRWLNCRCFCGEKFKASAWRIKSGHTKSCGCLVRMNYALRNVNTPYSKRCENAKKGWETRRKK